VFFQIALGAVYAWSVFRVPLTKQFGWSISQVTLTFTISIFVLGISAFFGGLWLNRKGPRVVALTGELDSASGLLVLAFGPAYFRHGLSALLIFRSAEASTPCSLESAEQNDAKKTMCCRVQRHITSS